MFIYLCLATVELVLHIVVLSHNVSFILNESPAVRNHVTSVSCPPIALNCIHKVYVFFHAAAVVVFFLLFAVFESLLRLRLETFRVCGFGRPSVVLRN